MVPPFFKEIFGDDAILRLAVALVGGILMGQGARWAGGCTSGHGISGTLQLSLASWIAVICFFASGIIAAGIIRLQIKPGSIGSTVLGGVIFGVGFAILGYCPGTAAAAFGSGAMDALMGMIGIVIGAGVFARLYPFLDRRILHWGAFPADTIAELVGLRPEIVAPLVAMLIMGLLHMIAVLGL